jgi:hypothetical protein
MLKGFRTGKKGAPRGATPRNPGQHHGIQDNTMESRTTPGQDPECTHARLVAWCLVGYSDSLDGCIGVARRTLVR